MLENIKSPSDIKNLTYDEETRLAAEIREKIIQSVSVNGGHLASNLGMVEATIVFHKIFSAPDDKIIFDVSHQCYTHKLLTGRYQGFDKLRREGGVSGFSDRFESEYDVLNEGHCGASLSAALGIAVANKLAGKNDYTVAVVGDGALSNGMIYEALNNCSDKDLKLIIVINDNDMSISRNVGGLHNYFSHIRTSKRYFGFKHRLEKFLLKIPLLGKPLASFFRHIKNGFKRLFVKNTLFEDLGLSYLGPVDGHNIKKLTTVLEEAKSRDTCCVVHIITQKGKGYEFAEKQPNIYHGVGAFDPSEGVKECNEETFSTVAGKLVCELAEEDRKICAITAAMCDGCGLTEFAARYKDRFFDVGIAEEHAITFAAGLSVSGMKPVVFLYSTFVQRSYDQLVHDISLQEIPLVLMLDRSGLVAGDGITHQGIFDYSMLTAIPGVKIYSPATYDEMSAELKRAVNGCGLSVIRYPKGRELHLSEMIDADGLSYTRGVEDSEIVIVTYGRIAEIAVNAAAKSQRNVGVVRLINIFPVNFEKLESLVAGAKIIYALEEGFEEGGLGEKIAAHFNNVRTEIHAIKSFVKHGTLGELYEHCGFTVSEIAKRLDGFEL